MKLTQAAAAALLDVPDTELVLFDELDTFNGDQRLTGYLCRRSDHRYGALVIGAVAGIDTEPQTIYATPKLHYPFGRTPDETREYQWPKVVAAVEVYEKLDGTNILAYSYAADNGERFITFKTRLTPVARASGSFGDFAGLWREMIAAHPELVSSLPVLMGELTLSFELYGHRNPHSIIYPEPLACRLLFGVDQARAASGDGVMSPASLASRLSAGLTELALKPETKFTSGAELTSWYESLRASADKQNTELDGGDRFEGTEGFVFYLRTPDLCNDGKGRWMQFKCKPESIEALHWTSDFIPLGTIIATTWAALEEVELEELDRAIVIRLLREEFTEAQCLTSSNRIDKAIETVTARLAWRERVAEAYKSTGLDWTAGKTPVMRALSQAFTGPQMKEVFNGLRELGIHNE